MKQSSDPHGLTAMAASFGKNRADARDTGKNPSHCLPRGWAGRAVALRRERRGIAAVEFALVAPILLALMVGIVDLGFAFSAQIKVQLAAQAGGQYAQLHGFDSTKISNAVTAATSLSVSANPAPSQSCGCVSGNSVSLSGTPPCTSTCANGLTPGTYVQVNSKATYTPLLPYVSVLSNPTTLTGQALVRVN